MFPSTPASPQFFVPQYPWRTTFNFPENWAKNTQPTQSSHNNILSHISKLYKNNVFNLKFSGICVDVIQADTHMASLNPLSQMKSISDTHINPE